jgi:hypothetical protein
MSTCGNVFPTADFVGFSASISQRKLLSHVNMESYDSDLEMISGPCSDEKMRTLSQSMRDGLPVTGGNLWRIPDARVYGNKVARPVLLLLVKKPEKLIKMLKSAI